MEKQGRAELWIGWEAHCSGRAKRGLAEEKRTLDERTLDERCHGIADR